MNALSVRQHDEVGKQRVGAWRNDWWTRSIREPTLLRWCGAFSRVVNDVAFAAWDRSHVPSGAPQRPLLIGVEVDPPLFRVTGSLR